MDPLIKSQVSRPAFGGIESYHPQRTRVLAAEDVFDDGRFVSFRFVGFAISAAKRPGAENLRLGLVTLNSIGAWICRERTALNSAGDNWMRCFRDRGAFPRSDGFDYDSDPGQRALDFTLHFFNLGI